MKKSKQETVETRQAILQAAALEFRRSGIEETKLSEIMASAGLTHGGFYRHFESKERLVAEACQTAFARVLDEMEHRAAGKSLATLVNSYLSTRHRDEYANACPLAALGSDLRRTDSETRDTASTGIERFIAIVSSQLHDMPPREAKSRAAAIVSAMVGGMVLARVVNDPNVSNSILKDTRDFILRE